MNGQLTCFRNEDQILGDFGVRVMHSLAKGYFIHEHVHNYSHLEVVIAGSIRLTVETEDLTWTRVYKQGGMANIPAGAKHTAESLEDGTIVYCIFDARNAEGEVTDMTNQPAFT
jgi:quercetin dioxygenase-like cupin family protein